MNQRAFLLEVLFSHGVGEILVVLASRRQSARRKRAENRSKAIRAKTTFGRPLLKRAGDGNSWRPVRQRLSEFGPSCCELADRDRLVGGPARSREKRSSVVELARNRVGKAKTQEVGRLVSRPLAPTRVPGRSLQTQNAPRDERSSNSLLVSYHPKSGDYVRVSLSLCY